MCSPLPAPVPCTAVLLQVEMYESCGASFAETSPELYTVALAYIAEGARHVRPAQLQRAIALLLTPAPFPLGEVQFLH